MRILDLEWQSQGNVKHKMALVSSAVSRVLLFAERKAADGTDLVSVDGIAGDGEGDPVQLCAIRPRTGLGQAVYETLINALAVQEPGVVYVWLETGF